MRYPPPAHALTIWTELDPSGPSGIRLVLGFDDATGSHSIHLPATPEGLARAVRILRDRHEAYARGSDTRIGTPAAPLQLPSPHEAAERARQRSLAKRRGDALAKLPLSDFLSEIEAELFPCEAPR